MLSHESLLVHLGSFRAYRIFRSCLKPVEVVAGCKFRVATGGLAVRRSHTNVAACILWFKMEVCSSLSLLVLETTTRCPDVSWPLRRRSTADEMMARQGENRLWALFLWPELQECRKVQDLTVTREVWTVCKLTS